MLNKWQTGICIQWSESKWKSSVLKGRKPLVISFPVEFYNWWSSSLITCYGHILVRKDSSITALSHKTRLADFARVSVPPQQHLCILVEIWRLSITKWWSVPSLPCLIHLSCHYFNVLCLIWRLTTIWSDILYNLTVF